jgi:butyrate kinase
MQLILVINPGSTSTKLAVYDGEKLLQDQTIRHTDSELKRFSTINQQIGFRQKLILEFLRIHHFSLTSFKAIVARGGLLRPIHSGTYLVNQRMLQDLASGKYGSHASNLGGLIACALAKPRKLPAYIVDPVVVDELDEIARISGTKLIARKVIFHALNQKAVARRYADSIKRPYTSLNLIVCHLGGGITVG